jgi:hypothetical protein
MIVELFKGRQVKSAYIKQEMVQDWQGALKSMTENDLRRLIIKMLMIGVLEE